MVFADTVVQIDAASLMAAVTTLGAAIAGGIIGAGKLLVNVIRELHKENQTERANMQETMNQQWALLSSLTQSTRATANVTKKIGRKVGACDDEDDELET